MAFVLYHSVVYYVVACSKQNTMLGKNVQAFNFDFLKIYLRDRLWQGHLIL